MFWVLLILVLIALLNTGLLVWIGVSNYTYHKETIAMANEQETRLDAALDVLKAGVAQLIVMVLTLVQNNPDLSDETASIVQLGNDIQAAIETAQGGGTPEPIPVPEPGEGGGSDTTGGGSTDGGASGSGDGGDGSSPGDASGSGDGSGGGEGSGESPGEVV